MLNIQSLSTGLMMDMRFSDGTTLELVLSTTGEQLTHNIANFKYQHGISKLVAVCGGSTAAGTAQEQVLTELFAQLRGFVPRIAILTGGTCGGLPEAATRLAHRYGLQVVAVVPFCAKPANLIREVACRVRVEALVEQSVWGQESAVFMNIADGMVLLGGGAGTLIELANALKINDSRLRASPSAQARAPIMIAPLSGGYGGVSDLVPTLLAENIISQALWDNCFPPGPLHTGLEAATYLLHALKLPAPPG